MPQDRGEEVDPLEDPAFRGRKSRVVHALLCVVGAIIDILESVVEVAAGVIHVVRRGICLSIVPRIRRDFSSHISLPYHRQLKPSNFQDLVVMFRQVVVVRTITKGISFLMLQGSTSTLRTPISRVVMASTQVDTCLISRVAWVSIQPVGHSGSLEDSPSRLMLLPVVLDRRDSTVRQVRGVIRRVEVFMLVEVEEDDSRPRGVSTILLCRTLRTIRI